MIKKIKSIIHIIKTLKSELNLKTVEEVDNALTKFYKGLYK